MQITMKRISADEDWVTLVADIQITGNLYLPHALLERALRSAREAPSFHGWGKSVRGRFDVARAARPRLVPVRSVRAPAVHVRLGFLVAA